MRLLCLRSVGPLMGLFLLCGYAWGQDEILGGEEDYILAPGDTIQVYIYNEDIPPLTLRINPRGYIMLPLVDSVKAAGLTAMELKLLLEKQLGRWHRYPQVTVNLVEQGFQRERIYTLGAFQKSGILPYQAGMTVLDGIAAAGGLTMDADMANASIRRGSKTLAVDLQRLLLKGDTTQNLALQPGDVIDVPRGEFYVIGSVQKPGRFPIAPEIRVLEAIGAAGGPTQEAGLREAVIFRRDGQNVPVDLWELLKNGSVLNNVPLFSGDILFIPESSPSEGVMVLGEVMQPGRWPYEPGETLIEVLQKRGLRIGETAGDVAGIEVNEATLIRAGEEPRSIDLRRLLKEGDLSLNLPIQPGDLIIVRRQLNKVTLLGRVNRPGTYLVPGAASLLEVLPQGGGFLEDADLRRVSIIRGEERLVRDLRALINTGQTDQNLDIQDGDVILVPQIDPSGQILVLGDVNQVGAHTKRDNETLMQAIQLFAGGLIHPDRRYEAQITRGETQLLRADLRALFKEGDVSQNLQLEEGDVIFVREKPEEVFVLGLVQRPGRYNLRERMSLADALGEAGGPVAERANLRKVRVIRGEEQIAVDLMSLYTDGDMTQNVALQANDVIVVPFIDQSEGVIVLGGVRNPGLQAVAEGERLLTALAQAGGVELEGGQPMAQIQREGKTLEANLRHLFEWGDMSQNLELQPGDVVVVRSMPEEITVVGEVARPGSYPLRRNAEAFDGLGAAGGVLEYADLSHIVLLRGEERRILNLERILKGQDLTAEDLAQNVLLEAGDALIVPRLERAEVVVVGEVAQPGVFPYREEMRLLDALALSRSFLPSADIAQTTIIRGDEQLKVDFNRFLKEGDRTQNMPLRAGDVVVAPKLKEANILVFGQVEKPGAYPPVEGMTVVDLMSTVKPTPLADLNRISLFRGEELISIDYEAVIDKGDVSQNLELQRGDRILVAEREQYFLFGAVVQPGMFPLKQDLKIAEILRFMRPEANLNGIRIIRPAPEGAEPEVLRPNLKRLMKEADESQNLAIQSGDFIYVPWKSRSRPWYANLNQIWYGISAYNLVNRNFF